MAKSPLPPPGTLGILSAKFEVGGRGPETVSTGKGDAGGVSYGSYQMTSKGGGTVAKFVKSSKDPRLATLKTLTPGTSAFTNEWKRLAAADRVGFFQLQHDFIEATHYRPVVDAIRAETGLNVEKRSKALQNVVWSTAVQHGGKTTIVTRVIQKLKESKIEPTDKDFDKKLITATYQERGRKNSAGTLVHFSKNSKAVQAGVAKRFVQEAKDALAMLAEE